MTKISRIFFWGTLILLPVNLGYHFILKSSYVTGFLVDYLIPTVYLQDIFAFLCIVFWILSGKGNFIALITSYLKQSFLSRIALLYVYTCLLTVLISANFESSFLAFVRLLLYFFFALYATLYVRSEWRLSVVAKIFAYHLVVLGILGTLQFFKQGAVFNNYLILGEQPYTASTYGITLENFFDTVRVPAYALFRHPNVFAGFVSLLLMWVYWQVEVKGNREKIFIWAFLAGVLSLLFTVSYFAFLSFLLGIALIKFKDRLLPQRFIILICFGLFVSAVFLPLLNKGTVYLYEASPLRFTYDASPLRFTYEASSFYRRSSLLTASYKLIKENFLFGVGYNDSTKYIEKYLPALGAVRFVQPVHNMFVLAFLETGFFGGILFLVLVIVAIFKSYTRNYLLFVNLLQLLVLGSFDHYFYTIHQTQLLFWFLLGLML